MIRTWSYFFSFCRKLCSSCEQVWSFFSWRGREFWAKMRRVSRCKPMSLENREQKSPQIFEQPFLKPECVFALGFAAIGQVSAQSYNLMRNKLSISGLKVRDAARSKHEPWVPKYAVRALSSLYPLREQVWFGNWSANTRGTLVSLMDNITVCTRHQNCEASHFTNTQDLA